ncbi:MAG: hypothetical protein ACXVCO_01205 [Ktedonobacterales bacterium]
MKARIQDLEAALGQKDHTLAITYKLSPTLSDLLGLLISVKVADPAMIQQRLEVVTDAKVAVHRLRKRMKHFGIEIHGRRLVGYWLDDETKERLRQRAARVPLQVVTSQVTYPAGDPPDNVIPFPALKEAA